MFFFSYCCLLKSVEIVRRFLSYGLKFSIHLIFKYIYLKRLSKNFFSQRKIFLNCSFTTGSIVISTLSILLLIDLKLCLNFFSMWMFPLSAVFRYRSLFIVRLVI